MNIEVSKIIRLLTMRLESQLARVFFHQVTELPERHNFPQCCMNSLCPAFYAQYLCCLIGQMGV